jgi:acyl-CoA synthetase (NDP forming)
VPALFARHGVIQVETVAELFDVAQLLAYQPLPSGRKVAVVTNSTALGTLAADACARYGLRADRPLDVGAQASAAHFAAALRTVTADPGIGALVVVFVPPLATSGEAAAAVLAEQTACWDRPVVSTFLAMDGVPAQLRLAAPDGSALRGSVPSYPSPERAVLALSYATRYAEWRREPAEAAELLAAYGIGPAGTADGIACAVGVVDDPSFGALVSFGIAGLATELLGDRAYAAVPLTDEQARALVTAPRAAPLLTGYRGAEPANLEALHDLLLRVARLADDLPEVLAAALDPVYAGPAGASVGTAQVRVGPPTARMPMGPRQLR